MSTYLLTSSEMREARDREMAREAILLADLGRLPDHCALRAAHAFHRMGGREG